MPRKSPTTEAASDDTGECLLQESELRGSHRRHGQEPAATAAEEEQINMVQDHIDAKAQELASTDKKLAQFEDILEDPEESLVLLKEKCSATDAESAKSVRRFVSLSSDAHDLLTKTFNSASCRLP